MIKILIDSQTFDDQKYGGISRYYTELITELGQMEEVQVSCPLLYTENIHYKESPLYRNSFQNKYAILIRYGRIFRPFMPRKLRKRSEAKNIKLLEQGDYDVFMPSYYHPYFLEHLADRPFVLTVHDMIHELFPNYFPEDDPTAAHKKLLMEKATMIIAVSENTKSDILKCYPDIPSSKIEVVYLSYTLPAQPVVKAGLPQKYILFVGNRSIYKNFNFALKAITPMLKEDPDLFLVCAGGGMLTPGEEAMILEAGLEQKVIQQTFKDAELSSYYQQARCMIFASEYEGFGIPVLEAMACGCPVVLASHSSFPEVAGDAGLYFELNDMESLAEKVRFILHYPDEREKYIARGLAQVKQFSWKKTAEGTLAVYRKAVQQYAVRNQ